MLLWDAICSDKGKYLDLGCLPTHVKLDNPNNLTNIEATILVAVLQMGGDVPIFIFCPQLNVLNTELTSHVSDTPHIVNVHLLWPTLVDDMDHQVWDVKVSMSDKHLHTDTIFVDDNNDEDNNNGNNNNNSNNNNNNNNNNNDNDDNDNNNTSANSTPSDQVSTGMFCNKTML